MIAVLGLVACGTPPDELVQPVLNPLLAIDRSVDRTPFDGTVAEVRPAGGYLYLRVDERWVVGLAKPVTRGDQVTVSPVGIARAFTSRRTGDHYDELVFGVVSKASP
ncbi:MAG: hypothetical protein AAF602_15945 [Myxococcota bacterium]